MKTLFGVKTVTLPAKSAPVMRAAGMKSLEASRAAFRLIQRAQHNVRGLTDQTIAKWVAASDENKLVMAEISEATNANSSFDRLRQLGNQSVTAAACYWLRKFKPELFEPLIDPLRGAKEPRWQDGKTAMWFVKESDPLFLLWNLLTLDRMTHVDAEEKMTQFGQLDLWDQSIAAAVEGRRLMIYQPRWPRECLLALDFSHVSSARPFLTARDFARGTG